MPEHRYSKGALKNAGDDWYSYETCILTKDEQGRDVANITKYSPTTSKHQSYVNTHRPEIAADHVPRGASAADLRRYAREQNPGAYRKEA